MRAFSALLRDRSGAAGPQTGAACLLARGNRQKLNGHAANGVTCSDWSCNQVPAGARKPPTRDAREARSSRRTDFHCGASL
jgi:hypothetical protein